VSVEDQKRADIRVPVLLDTPAAVRWLSCEPLLGRVDLNEWLGTSDPFDSREGRPALLDWVVVGGESGPGARPMHPDWARLLRDQCVGAGVPFHFKQRGEWTWSEPGEFQMPRQPFMDRVAVMHPAGMTAMTKANQFNPFERGHPDWATRIERVGKRAAGRLLDGRTWDEFPRMPVGGAANYRLAAKSLPLPVLA
jgi:protein gp37